VITEESSATIKDIGTNYNLSNSIKRRKKQEGGEERNRINENDYPPKVIRPRKY
jgi:hypothetical protein